MRKTTRGKKGNLAAAFKANLRVAAAAVSPEVFQARRVGKPKKPDTLLRKAVRNIREEGKVSGAVRTVASEDAIVALC